MFKIDPTKLREGISLSLKNAERLLDDAKLLFENSRYSSCKVLAMLSWEEAAKAWFILEAQKEKRDITEDSWKKNAMHHASKLDNVQVLMQIQSSPIFEDEMWEESLINLGFLEDHSTELKNARERLTYLDYDFENQMWSVPDSVFVLFDSQEVDCSEIIRIAEECISAVKEEMES